MEEWLMGCETIQETVMERGKRVDASSGIYDMIYVIWTICSSFTLPCTAVLYYAIL